MRKGITPVIAIVLLLIITVAVVGLAYGFITGFFAATTGTAIFVPGVAQCDPTTGRVTITVTNAGTSQIQVGSLTVVTKSCTGNAPTLCPSTGSAIVAASGTTNWLSSALWPLDTQETGTIATQSAVTAVAYRDCGAGNNCFYDVVAGGFPTPVAAYC